MAGITKVYLVPVESTNMSSIGHLRTYLLFFRGGIYIIFKHYLPATSRGYGTPGNVEKLLCKTGIMK